MADSSTNLDTVSSGQASKEVTVNNALDALSPASLFGRRATTTAGLTWGMYGGKYRKADGTITAIANATITLTASATNYILETDGVVSKVTAAPSGWPSPLSGGAKALYAVVCDGSGATSYTDYRTTGIGSGISSSTGTNTGDETAARIGALIAGATAKTTPVDADMLGIADSAASNVLKKLTWANLKAALKTYFDTLYATTSQPFDVTAFYPGVPSSSAKVTRVPVARAVLFPANFAGSYGVAPVAATGSTAFDVRKNGSSVGTITFAAGATTATFASSGGAAVTLAAGDTISITAPATADATLADVGFVLAGTR